ncbi:MAG: hypothetical protein J5614_04740 [Paludibacteraceae bacterium]|nr:hypothetical protein [Paludibacteraceae bacterium]
MKVSLVILIIIGYIIGLLITDIFIIVHDNFATFEDRFDNPEIVAMLWPITLPLILVCTLFMKLHKTAKDIGNKISIKLRYRRMGLKKPKEKRGKDNG